MIDVLNQPRSNDSPTAATGSPARQGCARADWPFWAGAGGAAFVYLGLILAMLLATALYARPQDFLTAMGSANIRYAAILSVLTCTVSALLALLISLPVGYVLSRSHFPCKAVFDALLDIPIILPPMVVGLCLLVLFQTTIPFTHGPEITLHGQNVRPPRVLNDFVPLTYTVGGVILAQFLIGAAFAVRTMRSTFDHLSARPEDVARTLGCSRGGAVWRVTLPAARRGMVAAYAIAWARSLGEFGPILVFAGATRQRTEVLPTTVWLELSVGNLEAAIAVSLFMVALALGVLIAIRAVGERP